jgi:hypothetical protein
MDTFSRSTGRNLNLPGSTPVLLHDDKLVGFVGTPKAA